MRVAINGTFWDQPATGSGQYVRQLTRALVECEPSLRQTLLFPAPGSLPGLTVTQVQPPDSNLRRPLSNLSKLIFEQLGFPRAARRLGADIAHVPYFAPPLLPITPTVVTIHDLIPLILPAYRGSWLVRLYMRLAALAAPRATAVIADSECSRRDIVRLLGIPAGRVHVVYLAAGDEFHPVGAASAATRQKYDLPPDYTLYLGGFDERKDVGCLLTAYAQVVAAMPDAPPLVVAGRPPARDSAFSPDPRRLAHDVGLGPVHVRFAGWVDEDDKPALYSAARLFVFPSRYEGFGLPLLEAMACGVPVIGADAASLPEIVGAAGLLVAPGEPGDLAAAILRVLRDPAFAADLRARGIARAQQFSWRRCAEETLAVYRQSDSY